MISTYIFFSSTIDKVLMKEKRVEEMEEIFMKRLYFRIRLVINR